MSQKWRCVLAASIHLVCVLVCPITDAAPFDPLVRHCLPVFTATIPLFPPNDINGWAFCGQILSKSLSPRQISSYSFTSLYKQDAGYLFQFDAQTDLEVGSGSSFKRVFVPSIPLPAFSEDFLSSWHGSMPLDFLVPCLKAGKDATHLSIYKHGFIQPISWNIIYRGIHTEPFLYSLT